VRVLDRAGGGNDDGGRCGAAKATRMSFLLVACSVGVIWYPSSSVIGVSGAAGSHERFSVKSYASHLLS
jgi:hypothetical protein